MAAHAASGTQRVWGNNRLGPSSLPAIISASLSITIARITMLTLPSMKSQVRLACRPVERAATERVCGARHTGQRPLSAVSRQGQTPARSVATSSRVTLSSPPITSLSRSSGQSPARSSLHAPVLGTSGGRRTLFHVQRAGLATPAEAQSTPAPDITRKPENPEDPEVYEGAPPNLVITDRAAQVRMSTPMCDDIAPGADFSCFPASSAASRQGRRPREQF